MKNKLQSGDLIRRYRNRHNSDEGFTLIELLIVVVVLGILAAIVVFALGDQTKDATVSACKADAKSVEVASKSSALRLLPTRPALPYSCPTICDQLPAPPITPSLPQPES